MRAFAMGVLAFLATVAGCLAAWALHSYDGALFVVYIATGVSVMVETS